MKKQKKKLKQRLKKVVLVMALYIMVEIVFYNLLIYILDNCITVYK